MAPITLAVATRSRTDQSSGPPGRPIAAYSAGISAGFKRAWAM